MPRRSEASLSIAAFTPGLTRLNPPVEFTEGSIERSLFVETVRSVAADHFRGEDRPTLAEYCRTMALAQRASEELRAAAVVGDRVSPWLEVHRVATKTALALQVRLRIGARSRATTTRTGKATASPSFYDTMELPDDPSGS
jgi:hypothetical protein